jgi:hypothetical protein
MFCGPWPVLKHARSSRKITSNTPCRRFSTPQCARDTGEGQSTESDRTIVACFLFDLSVSLALSFDPPDHGQACKDGFARVTLVRCHPVDLMTDCMSSASIRPPARSTVSLVSQTTLSGGSLKDIGVHSGPVLPQRHAIIAASVTDGAGNVRLCPHGIHGDQSAFQIEMPQQQRRADR